MKRKIKKISALIPVDLLSEATKISSSTQTEAIISGLEELIRASKRKSIIDLKGKLKIEFDIDQERERARF